MLTSKATEGVAKATELNISAINESLAESTDIIKKLLSVKNPRGFYFILSEKKSQPNTEGNSVRNSNMIRNQASAMTGTLTCKEREYTLEPQPKGQMVHEPDQTFWGRTSEEWMKTNPSPQEIFD